MAHQLIHTWKMTRILISACILYTIQCIPMIYYQLLFDVLTFPGDAQLTDWRWLEVYRCNM